MNVKQENLDRARALLSELAKYEDVKDVLGNYDAKAFATFRTYHNNNLKTTKEVSFLMPPEAMKKVKEYMDQRIFEIKKELETL